ncbi:hypothetical protein BX659_10163 [Orenia metallireducens]|uniref:STAS/SEC14 domain-containing protein n=1 Tax=Orenia metallireducens TaxID=1413210 RepID=A0A285FXU3_9FIRM|nr:hypothetical protein [Orenia metallireducens]PRX35572.1 hypothetical protein BX659_10163 [Orenia metallireducens]SNY15978.1 hypothetical protein SAMN06265827_103128 [Orenia metallireducens]
MYKLTNKEEFIVVTGNDIIDEVESKAICRKINELLEFEVGNNSLLLDVRGVNLNDSQFDIFIQYLSKIKVKRISIVLPELVNKFKFRLWKRKYKNYAEIEQFMTLEEAQNWLKKG